MLHLALNTAQEEKAAAQAQLATAMSTEEAAVAAAQAAVEERREAEAAMTIAVKDAKLFAENAAALRVERDGLDRRAQALTAELAAASEALAAQSSAQETMRTQLHQVQAECEALQASRAEANATIGDLRHAGASDRGAASHLQRQLAELEDERHGLQRETAHLSELLRAERASTAGMRTDIDGLEAGARDAQAREAALERRLEMEREQSLSAAQVARAAEAGIGALHKKVVEMEEMSKRYAQALSALQEQRASEVAARGELRAASLAKDRLETELVARASEAREATEALHVTRVECDALQAKLSVVEEQLRSSQAIVGSLEGEKSRLSAAMDELKANLTSGREALRGRALEAERQEQQLRWLQDELKVANERLRVGEEEKRQHFARVDELSGQLESVGGSLEEAQERVQAEVEARRLELTAREELVRSYAEERESRLSALRARDEAQGLADRVNEQLRASEAETSQLKSLVARMEVAHAETASKVEAGQTRLDAAQAAQRAEAESRSQCAAQLAETENIARDLRELVASLDAERDALSAAVDERAEEAVALKQSSECALQTVAESERQLLEAREQNGRQAKLLASLEAGCAVLQSRLDEASKAEAALRGAARANEEELANVSDDLRKMIQENQLTNEELQKAARSAERYGDESRRLEARVAQLQAAVEAGGEEKEEMLRSYRRQAEEVAAIRLSMSTLADERDSLRSQLSLLEEGYTELQRQSARVQGENAQLLLDLHAFEQQNDSLVRQLQASDGQFRTATVQKQVTEEQLASTMLVLGGLERTREVIQRDSASASRQMSSMRAQLEETEKEREILRQQLGLSRTRARENHQRGPNRFIYHALKLHCSLLR